jgi:hypothetical protein
VDYKLAKELKDAGFPQGPKETKVRLEAMRAPGFFLSAGDKSAIHNKNLCYVPTLSELIEACGKATFTLHYSDILEAWEAMTFLSATIRDDKYTHMKKDKGASPEEAVARLWLALNKK